MFLWKCKQNWQTSGQAHLEAKRENPNKLRNESGEITTDTAEKNHKRILWTAIHQQIQLLRSNGQFLETQSPPILQGGLEQTNQ